MKYSTWDCSTDIMTARAQICLAFCNLMGVLGLVILLVLYHGDMKEWAQALLETIIGALVSTFIMQNQFFYSRPRHSTIPDPPTGGVSATVLAPQGGSATVSAAPLDQPQKGVIGS